MFLIKNNSVKKSHEIDVFKVIWKEVKLNRSIVNNNIVQKLNIQDCVKVDKMTHKIRKHDNQ